MSLLMNSSNRLVSTMGFSKAPWTSCPKVKSKKDKFRGNRQCFRISNVAHGPTKRKTKSVLSYVQQEGYASDLATLGKKVDEKCIVINNVQG